MAIYVPHQETKQRNVHVVHLNIYGVQWRIQDLTLGGGWGGVDFVNEVVGLENH